MGATAAPGDRYAIRSTLGAGGMGVVVSAFDSVRGEEVALKRLHFEKFPTADGVAQARALFEREYLTLFELSHPNVISVYDYVVDETGPFYTMERLVGRSLRELAPIPFHEACHVIREAASALSLVHSRRLVHRDVSTMNIHCGDGGRVKLIDFGALMPMGVAKQIVGTPPFLAPECLQHQTLDGRADLFSLGACLYFALTGRHAYPARTLSQLHELWQLRPAPPSRYAPEVPPALDQLCLSLLRVDPAERPVSAPEVFERLTAIADLPDAEVASVATAYLTTPALVGRKDALERVRRLVLRVAGNRGAALLVRGAAGIGRSRILDAAAIEASLSGIRVIRADAADAQTPFGVVRALVGALTAIQPDLSGWLSEHGLSEFPVRSAGDIEPTAIRKKVLETLPSIFSMAAGGRGLAVIVDDLHLADEPSLALLATLSASTQESPLLLVVSVDQEALAAPSAAIRLLSETSLPLKLAPFSETECRALLASVFGEVSGLDVLSTLAFRACGGNPRRLMTAVQALVDCGLLRFERGTWIVPNDPLALERALSERLDEVTRLDALHPDAAEMAAVIALDRDFQVPFSAYASLTDHRDPGRTNRALDELTASGVATWTEDRRVFMQPGLQRSIAERLAPERKRQLHHRIAEAVRAIERPMVYHAFHFLNAGCVEEAIPAIDGFRDFVEATPRADIVRRPIVLDMLERFVELPEGVVNPALLAEHGAGFVINATYQGVPERAVRQARSKLHALAWLTGISDYPRLTDTETMPRLVQMMQLGQERCDNANVVGLNPIRAMRRLSQLCITSASCARFMADPSLFEAIPDLSPCAPLSPAIGVVCRLVAALAQSVHGRHWEAWDGLRAIHDDLQGSMGDGIDPLTRHALRDTTLLYVCSLEAEHGTSEATAFIDAAVATVPNLAESYRARHCYSIGDVQGAARARKRAELLSVRENALADTRIIELPSWLHLYALADDVMGLRAIRPALEQVVVTRPNWAPRAVLARAHIERCRNRPENALALLSPLLAEIRPGHGEWGAVATLHIDLLNRLRRYADVKGLGAEYLASAEQNGVPTPRIGIEIALALSYLGEHEAAEAELTSAHTRLERRGVSGIQLGYCYEIGARIAHRRGETQVANDRARVCAEKYRRGEGSVLAARGQDLMVRIDDEASIATSFGVVTDASRLAVRTTSAPSSNEHSIPGVEFTERGLYAEALSFLVERTGAVGGILFAYLDGHLERVGSTTGFESSDILDSAAREYFQIAASGDGETRMLDATEAALPNDLSARLTASEEGTLVSCVLECVGEGDLLAPGMVLLMIPKDRPPVVPHDAVVAVATALSRHVKTRAIA
jgi:hypothetical protein